MESATTKTGGRNTAMEHAVSQLVRHSARMTQKYIDPAIKQMNSSQNTLETELQRLTLEMEAITKILESVTLDPETSARMEDTRECLRRTNRKLTIIRGRLSRLRVFEERDGLQLTMYELQEINKPPSVQKELSSEKKESESADSSSEMWEGKIKDEAGSSKIEEVTVAEEQVIFPDQDEVDTNTSSELWESKQTPDIDSESPDMWDGGRTMSTENDSKPHER